MLLLLEHANEDKYMAQLLYLVQASLSLRIWTRLYNSHTSHCPHTSLLKILLLKFLY